MKFVSAYGIIATCLATLSPASTMWKRSFDCPPPEEIFPCECSTQPRKVVKCDDVKNLDIVHEALGHQFARPLPELVITNINVFGLPKDAFKNISTTKLRITRSNIRQIDDDAFDGQEKLKMLVLSEDRLTEFPSEPLKKLPGLMTLSLASNLLMKLDEKSLENAGDLKYLILVENRLSRIEKHAFPVTLKALSLGKNHLTTLNGTVSYLPALEMLVANNNRLSTVTGELRGLPRLEFLTLSHNFIKDIKGSFDELTSLTFLNLANNKLEQVEEGLFPLTELRSLNLSYNSIGDISESLFRRLNKLESLDLSGNYISNICPILKPLKNMIHLSLSDLNLKTLDVDCFKGMKALQSLDLSYNDLTNIDPVSGHPFPKLWSLNLQGNRLQSFRYGLKNLKHLMELDISGNHFTTIKDHHLVHNIELRRLRMGGNRWDCTDRLRFVLRDLALRKVTMEGNTCDGGGENAL